MKKSRFKQKKSDFFDFLKTITIFINPAQDNCHLGQLPPRQLPPRTIATKDNCHLGR